MVADDQFCYMYVMNVAIGVNVHVCFVVRVKVLHVGELLTTNISVHSCLEELSCLFLDEKTTLHKSRLTTTDVSISSASLHPDHQGSELR